MSFASQVLREDERAIYELRSLYSKYGYSHYRVSKFEEYDLYAKNRSFLVSENLLTFTDTNGKLMALKPDVTLSIVKKSKDTGEYVQKLYYDERQMHTKIYIDASRSMCHGSEDKAEQAIKIAACFAYLSVCEMEKVSVYAIHGNELEEIIGGMVGKEAFVTCIDVSMEVHV